MGIQLDVNCYTYCGDIKNAIELDFYMYYYNKHMEHILKHYLHINNYKKHESNTHHISKIENITILDFNILNNYDLVVISDNIIPPKHTYLDHVNTDDNFNNIETLNTNSIHYSKIEISFIMSAISISIVLLLFMSYRIYKYVICCNHDDDDDMHEDNSHHYYGKFTAVKLSDDSSRSTNSQFDDNDFTLDSSTHGFYDNEGNVIKYSSSNNNEYKENINSPSKYSTTSPLHNILKNSGNHTTSHSSYSRINNQDSSSSIVNVKEVRDLEDEDEVEIELYGKL
jgi:hypothetical protein